MKIDRLRAYMSRDKNRPRVLVAIDTVDCLVIHRTWFTALSDTRPSLKITLLQELMREISARLRQANVEISALHRA